MKSKLLVLLIALLSMSAIPAFAQDDGSTTHHIAFDGFSFSFDAQVANNVSITQYPGDASDLAMPGAPEVRHTEFVLYSGGGIPIPAAFEAPGFVRVYNTADFAGYTWHETQLAQLQSLLENKPDLAAHMVLQKGDHDPSLPFIPGVPAGQVIRARAAYVETDAVKGIVYMTIYRQDAAPAYAYEFMYTFQGISTDGAHYVSAVFRPIPFAFPAEIEAFNPTTFDASLYYANAIIDLNRASPDDFVISLNLLDAVIGSFAFDGE